MNKILVTGGLGFIGSETVITLIEAGYEPVVVDNLYNAKEGVLDRIETITHKRPRFYLADCTNKSAMEQVFSENEFKGVIHFAAYKAVGESVGKPLEYYRNNLVSALTILEVMQEKGVTDFIFSSSATVYGVPKRVPLFETDPIGDATNPYGETKIMIERILTDAAKANPKLNIALLRYFNPIGGHPSGLLGEDPNGIPTNLMPYITQVAIGKLPFLRIYGSDYKTSDGTGVRDYIHVVDLAEGHVAALKKLAMKPGLVIYNLGTGSGTSVLELVKAFEKANNVIIPYRIEGRRPGDVDASYADCSKAKRELGWSASHSIEEACRDAFEFQKKNPNGIQ